MKTENLERGNQLQPLIKNVKTQIDKWEKATSFKTDPVIDARFPTSDTGYSYVDMRHIPFNIAKAISLDGFRNMLNKLEDEFNSL